MPHKIIPTAAPSAKFETVFRTALLFSSVWLIKLAANQKIAPVSRSKCTRFVYCSVTFKLLYSPARANDKLTLNAVQFNNILCIGHVKPLSLPTVFLIRDMRFNALRNSGKDSILWDMDS